MPQFVYSARDTRNQPVTGTLDALSPAHVADWLANAGMTPLAIEAAQQVEDARDVLGRVLRRDRINRVDLLLFSRQMHTLTRAGIPIMQALQSLSASATRPAVARLMDELHASLDAGLELSAALRKHPQAFDSFYCSMVMVGETAGQLEEIFLALHHHLAFQKLMREQVSAALRYPAFVVAAMVGAVAVINLVVIPAFAKVFANLGAELPLMTRLLLGSSRFMLDWWPALLALGAAGVLAWRAFVGTESGRLAWDRWLLRLPLAGVLVRKGALAQAARGLALVFRSGVPIVRGLTLTAEVVQNAHMARALSNMRTAVERGENLLGAARRADIFTPVVLQMIAVGETTGSLSEMLDNIGEMFQQELEYELKGMSAKVEPILVVMLGAMVLVLALGVFLPMWEMGSHAIH